MRETSGSRSDEHRQHGADVSPGLTPQQQSQKFRRIEKVSEERSFATKAWDNTRPDRQHRYQRVNREIDAFNAELDSIMQNLDTLGRLTVFKQHQSQREEVDAQVKQQEEVDAQIERQEEIEKEVQGICDNFRNSSKKSMEGYKRGITLTTDEKKAGKVARDQSLRKLEDYNTQVESICSRLKAEKEELKTQISESCKAKQTLIAQNLATLSLPRSQESVFRSFIARTTRNFTDSLKSITSNDHSMSSFMQDQRRRDSDTLVQSDTILTEMCECLKRAVRIHDNCQQNFASIQQNLATLNDLKWLGPKQKQMCETLTRTTQDFISQRFQRFTASLSEATQNTSQPHHERMQEAFQQLGALDDCDSYLGRISQRLGDVMPALQDTTAKLTPIEQDFDTLEGFGYERRELMEAISQRFTTPFEKAIKAAFSTHEDMRPPLRQLEAFDRDQRGISQRLRDVIQIQRKFEAERTLITQGLYTLRDLEHISSNQRWQLGSSMIPITEDFTASSEEAIKAAFSTHTEDIQSTLQQLETFVNRLGTISRNLREVMRVQKDATAKQKSIRQDLNTLAGLDEYSREHWTSEELLLQTSRDLTTSFIEAITLVFQSDDESIQPALIRLQNIDRTLKEIYQGTNEIVQKKFGDRQVQAGHFNEGQTKSSKFTNFGEIIESIESVDDKLLNLDIETERNIRTILHNKVNSIMEDLETSDLLQDSKTIIRQDLLVTSKNFKRSLRAVERSSSDAERHNLFGKLTLYAKTLNFQFNDIRELAENKARVRSSRRATVLGRRLTVRASRRSSQLRSRSRGSRGS